MAYKLYFVIPIYYEVNPASLDIPLLCYVFLPPAPPGGAGVSLSGFLEWSQNTYAPPVAKQPTCSQHPGTLFYKHFLFISLTWPCYRVSVINIFKSHCPYCSSYRVLF